MTTMLEQSTTAQVATALVPSVTYDLDNKLIHVTVLVSPSSDPDPDHPFHFDAPIFGVPGSGVKGVSSTWGVIWTVAPKPDSGLDSVIFIESGIQIPKDASPVPDAVHLPIHTASVSDHPDRWTATITHHVDAVNSFDYRLFVQGCSSGVVTSGHHDPTIAVVTDPIGG